MLWDSAVSIAHAASGVDGSFRCRRESEARTASSVEGFAGVQDERDSGVLHWACLMVAGQPMMATGVTWV